jgi:hypothetical protein
VVVRRRLGPLVVALAAAPGLAACGGDGGDGAPPAPRDGTARPDGAAAAELRRAAQRTARAPGLRVSIDQRVRLGPQAIRATGEGAFGARARRGALEAELDLSRAPAAARLGGGGARVRQRVVRDGATLYVTSAVLARLLPRAQPWLRVDLGRLGRASGLDLTSLAGVGAQDPGQALRYLRYARRVVRHPGTATVRGRPATRYTATLDLRRAARGLPAADRAGARATLAATGADLQPTEVWVGPDGRIARVRQTSAATLAGQVVRALTTIELHDFGRQAAVRLPPASKVIDAEEAFPYAFERGG